MNTVIPNAMDEYVGSDAAKAKLRALLAAAATSCQRAILTGPIGSGKEQLAVLAAKEFGFGFFRVQCCADLMEGAMQTFFGDHREPRVYILSDPGYLSWSARQELLAELEKLSTVEGAVVLLSVGDQELDRVDPDLLSLFSERIEIEPLSEDEMRLVLKRGLESTGDRPVCDRV